MRESRLLSSIARLFAFCETASSADSLEPIFEKTKAELGDRARSDEDVLSYIAFPQVAEKFFASREEKESNTVNYTIEKKED